MNWFRSIPGFRPASSVVRRLDAAFAVSTPLQNCVISLAAVAVLLALATAASAQTIPADAGKAASSLPPVLLNVGFEPPLNGQIPLDTAFRDETGRDVRLRDYFGRQKPVLLALVYYSCPMLCDQVEQGVVGSLKMLSFNAGRDFEVVFVSFDSRETPEMAAKKKYTVVSHYNRPDTADGWHFLTGSQDSIGALTKAANFRYSFDAKSGIFAHASGILLLTPDGRISRYFYGVEYPSRDVRLGLVDASAGKIGTPIDHLLLYCFEYDPSAARYSATILRIVRLGGIATILVLVAGFLIFRRRDVRPALNGRAEQGAH
jgi:protein SCO1